MTKFRKLTQPQLTISQSWLMVQKKKKNFKLNEFFSLNIIIDSTIKIIKFVYIKFHIFKSIKIMMFHQLF